MNLSSTATPLDGVTEQSFDVDEIPGVLWTPAGATGPRPLILLGHGGGQQQSEHGGAEQRPVPGRPGGVGRHGVFDQRRAGFRNDITWSTWSGASGGVSSSGS